MRLFDISLPLHASLAVWPGDTPFQYGLSSRIGEDSAVNVGSLAMSVHQGTHVDAPFHFLEKGATIDSLDLNPFLGLARLIDVSRKRAIRTEEFAPYNLSQTPRVLLRTNAWLDHTRFPDWIPVLDSDVPAYLKEQGVVLVGLDVPSVDPLDSKSLPNHHALAAYGIHILESLRLTEPPEGVYELLALPLKVIGGDGAPVRAVLRSDE